MGIGISPLLERIFDIPFQEGIYLTDTLTEKRGVP
jgi:hypothetical protein